MWLALLLTGAGFLGDGTNRFPQANPPATWTADGPFAWRTALPTWSNASPVRFGTLVCTTEEPVTLTCLDAATGAVRWRAVHDVVGTLPAAEQGPLRERVTAYEQKAARVPELLREQSALRRELRRAEGTTELVARLEAISREIFEVQSSQAGLLDYLTPADQDQIGWATPTPVTDGQALYALFANGVVARHAPDGKTAWVRWLGAHPREPMNGYTFGVTASPVLAGGVLVVPYDDLLGLDPATGATKWTVPRWRDYGGPSVVTVGGVAYLASPDGRLVRASDGVVVLDGLPSTFFNVVAVDGTDLYTAASKGPHGSKEATVSRVTLAPGGPKGVTATVRWTKKATTGDRIYASPLVAGNRLVVVDSQGLLLTFDTATGADAGQLKLPSSSPGHYATPALVGDRVLVGSESGTSTFVRLAPAPTVLGSGTTEGFRSTPLPEGGRVYLRTLRGMVAIGR